MEDWRDLWMDIGILAGVNHDGMHNTNNWVEHAFKTFDTMFLDSWENRCLDWLVVILAKEFLPFYEPNKVRNNQKTCSALQLAHQLWSTPGMVQETQPGIWQVTQTQKRSEVDSSNASMDLDDDTKSDWTDDDDPVDAYYVLVQREPDGALTCACTSYHQTG
ncbi:hypothetical protein FRB94_010078 [Tulasnella sp. JGI-2019a]|nr:hypothetical protein FRB94_010078 [Tulasnella sp. JGI-2019a]